MRERVICVRCDERRTLCSCRSRERLVVSELPMRAICLALALSAAVADETAHRQGRQPARKARREQRPKRAVVGGVAGLIGGMVGKEGALADCDLLQALSKRNRLRRRRIRWMGQARAAR